MAKSYLSPGNVLASASIQCIIALAKIALTTT
jgi:hypothetical protein